MKLGWKKRCECTAKEQRGEGQDTSETEETEKRHKACAQGRWK